MSAVAMYSEEWWASDAARGKTRCKATARHGEGRCRKAVALGSLVCRKHGGAAPQVIRKARERLALAADDAASSLIAMIQSPNTPPAVKLGAVRDLLDRADITAKTQVEIEIKPWQAIIPQILKTVPADDDGGAAGLQALPAG